MLNCEIRVAEEAGSFDIVAADSGLMIRHAVMRAVFSETFATKREVCMPDSWETERFHDEESDYEGVTTRVTGTASGLRLTVEIRQLEKLHGFLLTCEVTNMRDRPIRLHRIDPLYAVRESGGALVFEETEREYAFIEPLGAGAVSLPRRKEPQNSRLYGMWKSWNVEWERPADPIWDEEDWLLGEDAGGAFHSGSGLGLFGGFFRPCGAFGEVGLRCPAGGGEADFFLSSLMDGVSVDSGETREGETALLLFGSLEQTRRIWLDECARTKTPRRRSGPITGWCSWYQLEQAIQEKDIDEAIRQLAEIRSECPMELIQIDDGFQKQVGDWEADPKKFPSGMRALADRISAAGFMPGLWLAPTQVHESASVYRDHPEWLQSNSSGERRMHFNNWGQQAHGLDPTHPEALAFVGKTIRKATSEWGFRYLKIDFTYNLSRGSVLHDAKLTHLQAHRRLFEAIREEAGEETYVLACGHPWSGRHLIDLADAARTGGDQFPEWLHLRETLPVSIGKSTLQNVWWNNDPDVFYLREQNSKLDLEGIRLVSTVTALMGGAVLTSDFPAVQWDEGRRDIASRLLPPSSRAAHNVYPLQAGEPEQFAVVHRDWDGDARVTAAAINWGEEERNIRLSFADLGLEPGLGYHAWELWRNEYAGIFEDEMQAKQPGRSVRLWQLAPIKSGMHVVGSSFHLGGSLKEIESLRKTENGLSMTLRPNARSGTLLVFSNEEPVVNVPEGCAIRVIRMPGANEIWHLRFERMEIGVAIRIQLLR